MKPRVDRISLLAADAKRAMDGLSFSLTKGSQGMAQGAMHARDLAMVLAQIGLDSASSLVEEAARQLTAGHPTAIDGAMKLVPLIDQALTDLDSDSAPIGAHAQEQWLALARQFQNTLDSRPTADFPNPTMEPDGTSAQSPDAQIEWPVDAPTGTTQPLPGATQDHRIHGLRLIQQARTSNARDDERSVRQIDAILSELQDWTLRMGQRSLSTLYPEFQHFLQDVWLDQSQLDGLSQLSIYAKRASKISAQSRSLTVFMDWHGLILNPTEWNQMGQVLANMRGHVKETPEGYRMVFPSSLNRMRVVPFMLKGQRYAVAAAQYLNFEPLDSAQDGSGKILMRSGHVSKALAVDLVLTAQNANVTAIPDLIERPDWMVGVVDGHMGEVYSCVVPK